MNGSFLAFNWQISSCLEHRKKSKKPRSKYDSVRWYAYNLSKSLNFVNVANPPACKQRMHLGGKSGFSNIYKHKDKRDPISEVKKHWLLQSSYLDRLPVKTC
jgi:hypothetical protein